MRRILLLLMLSVLLCTACVNEPAEVYGEPDVAGTMVTTFSDGSGSRPADYQLRIIANRSKIENEEEFAEQVLQMFRENKFQSVQFSFDMGRPIGLYADVYLTEQEMELGDVAMTIDYVQDDGLQYSLLENPEEFEMRIN